MYVLFMLLSGCAATQSDCAKDYLRAAAFQRTMMFAGSIDLRWTLIRPERPVPGQILVRGWWDDGRYRTDVMEHSYKAAIYGPDSRKPGETLEVSIWNGEGAVIKKVRNSTRYLYLLEDHPRTANERLFSPTCLGLPRAGGSQSEPAASMCLDYDVRRLEKMEDGLVRIDLAAPDSGQVSMLVWFLIDPSRDYAVTEYGFEAIYKSAHDQSVQTTYTVHGTNELELVGNVWFPMKGRHEQRRNGEFHWANEFEVLSLQMSAPPDSKKFTWADLDVPAGELILSTAAAFPSFEWTEQKAAPIAGQLRSDGK